MGNQLERWAVGLLSTCLLVGSACAADDTSPGGGAGAPTGTSTGTDTGTGTGTDTGTGTGTDTGTGTGTDTGTGTGTDTGTGTGAPACSVSMVTVFGSDAACDACVAGACCSQLEGLASCDPATDADQCDGEMELFDSCGSGACPTACFYDVCSSGTGFNYLSSCVACMNTHCCSEHTACSGDSTCAACLADPQDSTCCQNAAFNSWLTCIDGSPCAASDCAMFWHC